VEGHERRASELCTELGFSSFLLLLLFGWGCTDDLCNTGVTQGVVVYHIFDFVRRKEGALHRAVVFEVVSGAARGPDHGSDRALEVGDRDRSLEDAHVVVVSGVFSLSEDSVHGSRW